MSYNEILSERTALFFEVRNVEFKKKKMFGGICFMVDDKMCVGINKDSLMVRLDPEKYLESLQQDGAREMDFTGRPMKGFIFVASDVLTTDEELGYWIDLALEYNPRAKSSKKKKR